ncbi:hypothetical protein [Sphingomonas sp.]|uniref:hypothetical protein n=1 Tax=Sphingomonas sp. TaxID=28214 RepID=UPI0035C879BA
MTRPRLLPDDRATPVLPMLDSLNRDRMRRIVDAVVCAAMFGAAFISLVLMGAFL